MKLAFQAPVSHTMWSAITNLEVTAQVAGDSRLVVSSKSEVNIIKPHNP